MNSRNRDLLVLTKKAAMNAEELEHEIELLNDLLYLVESCNTVCIANEIVDLNRYKIIQKIYQVRQLLKDSHLKPFVFICNKN
ncbi:MAG: hypothetical protein ABJA79_00435 [Parafilimonas sp.]